MSLQTVKERVEANKVGFEKMLKDTEGSRGFWLINHREIIEDYLNTWAEGKYWDQVTRLLKDNTSALYKNVNALIMLARDHANTHYRKDIMELNRIEKLDCAYKALCFMEMEDTRSMQQAARQYNFNWKDVF